MRTPLCFAIGLMLLLAEMGERSLRVVGQTIACNEGLPSDLHRARKSDRGQYVAVAFHDVVDDPGDGDDNAVTASNLISFFEWLRANDWTAITLDDIERAKSGEQSLPKHAVLITFDDGYRSLYTRVYPLLLAYRIPVIAALVGSWMEVPEAADVVIDNHKVPRSNFVSWVQVHEMVESGLVEVASHSYDLHHSHLGNPQGGQMPAAVTLAYDKATGYETEESYRQRVRADLECSREQLQTQMGKAPRALVWPYGRYTGDAGQAALAAQYKFLLTLDPEPGFAEDLPIVPRLLPAGDENLPKLVTNLPRIPSGAVRIVRLNPSMLQPTDSAVFEKTFDAAIERLRALGATTLVVDAAVPGPQGNLKAVWFPNRVLPVEADVLSRIVWQMRTRAHVDVALSLPVTEARASLGNDVAVLQLFEDLGKATVADALLIERAPSLAIPVEPASSQAAWEVRRRRHSLDVSQLPATDALALRAFFIFEKVRPPVRLFLLTSAMGHAPSAIADLTLLEAPVEAKPFGQLVDRLAAWGWFNPDLRYRYGVWIRAQQPPSASVLSARVRAFERRGGVAFGWEPDNPVADEPKAAAAAPAVSAATFPLYRKR